MNIIVNGKNLVCNNEQVTVSTILQMLEIPSVGVAIAIDTTVIPKVEWETFRIQEGTKITIIRATQGG